MKVDYKHQQVPRESDILGGRYRLANLEGSGTFGTVWRAEEILLDTVISIVAIKIFNSRVSTEKILREIETLGTCNHPNILQYRATIEHKEQLCLVTEFAEGGNAFNLIKAFPHGLPLEQVEAIIVPVAEALIYLHEQNIVHRDVKPENVLLTDKNEVRLGDVGIAKVIKSQLGAMTSPGSLAYEAPEVVLEGMVGNKSDVYSLGVTAYELLTGHLPFGGNALDIKSALQGKPPEIPSTLPDRWQNTLRGCLEKDWKKRWQTTDVIRYLRDEPLAEKRRREKQRFEQAKTIAETKNKELREEIKKLQEGRKKADQHRQEILNGLKKEQEKAARIRQRWEEVLNRETERWNLEGKQLAEERRLLQIERESTEQSSRNEQEKITLEKKRISQEKSNLEQVLITFQRQKDRQEEILKLERNQLELVRLSLDEERKSWMEKEPQRIGDLWRWLWPFINPLWSQVQPDLSLNSQEIWPVINDKDGLILVLIPEGKFWAGGAGDDEGGGEPIEVWLPSYFLAMYPITNRQYAYFIKETGYRCPEKSDFGDPLWHDGTYPEELADHPVVCVSWEDAQAYCEWAGLRLPTELEWERGARGGDGREFPWGHSWDPHRCRYSENRGNESSCSVNHYPGGISPWRLMQMSGNVWEWCEDIFDKDFYTRLKYAGGDLRRVGQQSGTKRVLRGGSWMASDPNIFRCAYRGSGNAKFRSVLNGFRPAKSVAPAGA